MNQPDFLIGYARVSTTGQTLDAQLDTLKAAGCRAVYCEKASGARRTGRTELAKAIDALPHGGVLVVTKLDRLGRRVKDTLQILADIEARGARLRSLGEPWMDTTGPVRDLIFYIIGWAAEMERGAILERTAEGLQRAKAAGKTLGRPGLLTVVQKAEAWRLHQDGRDFTQIGQLLRVSRNTISRFIKAEIARRELPEIRTTPIAPELPGIAAPARRQKRMSAGHEARDG